MVADLILPVSSPSILGCVVLRGSGNPTRCVPPLVATSAGQRRQPSPVARLNFAPDAIRTAAVVCKPATLAKVFRFPAENRFVRVVDTELPSDPASRRGRLVYRRPVSASAAGWPESPQNPVGLAIAGLGPPRSRFETFSEPTGQDTGCLVIGASKSSRTLGVSG